MAFHETLRALRLAKGLTQPALAEAAQIEQSYLSKLENGRSSPSDEVLARLATALGASAEELMRNGSGNGAEDGASAARMFRPRFLALGAVLLGAAVAGGWFLRGVADKPSPGTRAESRINGSLTERLHAYAPPEVRLERVSIDSVDGTITLLGRTVGRDPMTAYLATLRRAEIGEATLLQFSDDDTRFHLVLAPFEAPAPETVTSP